MVCVYVRSTLDWKGWIQEESGVLTSAWVVLGLVT